MPKRVAILQSNYIPWKGYFDIIRNVDAFIFYDSVQYTKNDWRNRNKIKTPNGVEWITIPVEFKSLGQRIDETQVARRDWNIKHWKTLSNNYAKAPCFRKYKDLFEDIYTKQLSDVTNLSQINFILIKNICDFLGIKTELLWDKDLGLIEGKTEKLVDLCQKMEASEYVSGPAAKDYLEETLFASASIKVTWMDYSGYKEYAQMFPPFEHGVSILDLLFNTGENAVDYLKSF